LKNAEKACWSEMPEIFVSEMFAHKNWNDRAISKFQGDLNILNCNDSPEIPVL